MTFDIPADVQAGVSGISDLDLRVAPYLRHEARLEAIRRQRHTPQAREIVAEALRQSESDMAAGFDWDESLAQLPRRITMACKAAFAANPESFVAQQQVVSNPQQTAALFCESLFRIILDKAWACRNVSAPP